MDGELYLLSLWAKKKEQQKIFDDIITDTSIDESDQIDLLLNRDGQLVTQKAKSYVRSIRKAGIIIDAGCGTGTFMKEAIGSANRTYYVIGLDLSPESLKIAKQKNKSSDFIVCDIEALPFLDKMVDMIIVRNVLHHFSNLKPLISLFQILKPGGLVFIDDKIGGNPFQDVLTLAYPLMPHRFKMMLREKDDHIDRCGRLPPIKRYNPRAYLNFIKQYSQKVNVIAMEYHGPFLFLSILKYVSYFLPKITNIRMPIYRLYLLEKHWILRWSAISVTIIVESV
jgi:ubiquinone/menaquinone biosynthesis C-methylase UbiE